jgi:hypothetical protein
MGRLIGERLFQIVKAADFADIQVPLHNPAWRSFTAEASLLQGEREMDKRISDYLFYIPDRKLKEFGCFVWNWLYLEKHPDYTHDFFRYRLLDCGFNGIEGKSVSLDMPFLSGLSFILNKHNPKEEKGISQQLANYNKTNDIKFLERSPCLSDHESAEARAVLEKQQKTVERARMQKPVFYSIGDENTITYEAKPIDFCFAPHCLSKFREWLKVKYLDLADLNKEWDRNFASWDDVLPITKEQALQTGNYASWCDHRHFMQDVFTYAYTKQIDAVHELDPDVPVGPCGTRPLGAYTGIEKNFMPIPIEMQCAGRWNRSGF